MKITSTLAIFSLALGACSSTPTGPTTKRTQIRDCPAGMVLICETRRHQEPSAGGDEEIPEYDHCYCKNAMN